MRTALMIDWKEGPLLRSRLSLLARAHGGDLTLAKAQSDWTEFCLRLSASSIHVDTQKPRVPTVAEKKETG
jgi:hypothetical protein